MLGETLVRYRGWLLVLGVIVVAAATPLSRQLTLDRQITSMFAEDDDVLRQYQRLQAEFGGNVVVMLVYRDDALLTTAGIDRNRRLTERVAGLPGVRGVLSPAKLNDVIAKIRPASLFGFGGTPEGPQLADPDDPVALGFLDLFAGYTHSSDLASAAVVAILDPDHPAGTIRSLQRIASGLDPPIRDGVVVGEPVLVNDGFDLIQRDGAKLATWTITLLSLVIIVALRSLRYTVLVVVCIGWAVTVTRGLMVVIGVELSIVSTILTAIVTVVVVAAILHLGVLDGSLRHGSHRRGSTTDRGGIAASVLQRLWVPITWTCLTDAAGFLSLIASSIRPVREFGIMIGTSAVASLVAISLFAPVVMCLGNAPIRSPSRQAPRGRIATRLTRWVHVWIARRRVVVAMSVSIAIAATFGAATTKTETSFLKNFRDESDLARAYAEVENDLGGAGVWDVVLPAPDVLTSPYMDSVRQLETDLRAIEVGGESLTKVISMADAEIVASKVKLLSLGPPEVRMTAMRTVLPVFADALLTPVGDSPRRLRIMLRSREQLTTETKSALIHEVRRTVTGHTSTAAWRRLFGDGDPPPASVTGYYVMLAELVGRLVADQWLCFGLSFVLVLALLWTMSLSFRLAGVAVLANVMPALLVLAAIGGTGGKLNLGAAMIAAVSIGLSIDGSVHVLHHYRRQRREGKKSADAAVVAAAAVGTPMVLAMLALVIGFGVLSTSEFVPTATFGLLVAVTLVLGTLINLTVLPAAIVWADAGRGRTAGPRTPVGPGGRAQESPKG